ncbi:pectinesterase inhibitor [Humulus lupulus]|uniref:pectinesterase inhibitor n=1 Tax=Humulus lupulus TaxID=3486 RepID=UPI002B409B76|nr:pectinesterase inhibitor [Humulus lupulus]
MDTRKVLSLFLTLVLFFILYSTLPTSSSSSHSQLVRNICKETINYTKCIETLEADPRTKSPKNLNAFAEDSIRLAMENANESLHFIEHMVKNKTSGISRSTRAVLKQCVKSYKAVVASFKSALEELSEDAMTANYDVKVAVDFINDCGNEMSSKQIRVPSMPERNEQVRLFSSIGDVITTKLIIEFSFLSGS